jgi:hypothetical protein
MRPRPETGSGIEVLRALTRLDDALNNLKAVLSSQDRGLTTLGCNLTDLQKSAAELRATIGEIEATVNGETRALREELLGQGTRLDLLASKLSQIESLQGSVASMVDKRLRALNTQVTTAVAAMAIVVAVGMVLLVLLR